MSTKLDEINNDLINLGFKITKNDYIYEKLIQNKIIVNGQPMIQEQKMQINMTYVGDCSELDENDNEIENSTMCGFDIKDETGCSLITVFLSNAHELKNYINL